MKFRDPKTGEVFDNLAEHVRYKPCSEACATCLISVQNNGKRLPCVKFAEEYPAEAARLMGYEIIEDDMSTEKPNKSTEDHNKTSEISTENVKKPRWTEQDVEDAKAVRRIFSDAEYIERTHTLDLRCSPSGRCMEIDGGLFPSLAPGQSVTLDEIIGGEA